MSDQPKVMQLGGVSWNTMVYLERWPESPQGSGPASGWQQALGSTGAGKALNLQRLGFEVHLHSLLGSDSAAKQICDQLLQAGIHCHWQQYRGASEQHLNLMLPGGERRSIFLEQEPDFGEVDIASLAPVWAACDYHWVNIKPYCRRLLPALQAFGKPIWCDLHDYDSGNPYHQPFIDAADYLMASAENLADCDRFMQQQIEAGKRLVIVTDGGAGLRAMDAQGQRYHVEPAPGIELVDSNGAGDAFSAGLLWGWHQRRPLLECLQLGACAGALCVTSRSLASEQLDIETLRDWHRRYYA
ncbi:carbohydrate kinase family protein [Marinobacterium arenosum]|uniref:carbohydrate kinase family protein n=1 Tax=Marinobacterium arenosum TaxID=2862496 RepID=UPI001C98806A|nr:carbohydrate kinase family protein [Marinobacterium arenosum]MBY4677224.1 carbohydrate kinase family protein [Marinobacterium arenosum]